MTISRYLSSRKIGFLKNNIETSFLLENFECRPSDEFIIYGEEDNVSVPPLASSFCNVLKHQNILSLVDENGYLLLYDTDRTGAQAVIKDWQAHTNAIFDISWMTKEVKLITASGDQTSILWDIPTGNKLEVFKGHTSSVKSVAFRKDDDAVFATGSRDGHIMVWDKRCAPKDGNIPPVNTIRNAHVLSQQGIKQKKKLKLGPAMDSQQSVTNVIFQDSMNLMSSGAVDGFIKVWDLRKNYSTATVDAQPSVLIPYAGTSKRKHGFSSLVFDSSRTRLFANCTDDIIYMYDCATMNQKPICCFKGHKNTTFYIKSSLSPDDKYLLSGSSDELGYIWQVDKPNKPPVVLNGHRAEVTSASWSKHEFSKLVTLSDDNTMRIWRLNRRQSPPTIGEITGFAERTHKEVGTSIANSLTTSLPPLISNVENLQAPKPQDEKVAESPKRDSIDKTPLKSLQNTVRSPSVKDWLKLSTPGKNCNKSSDAKQNITPAKCDSVQSLYGSSANKSKLKSSHNSVECRDNSENIPLRRSPKKKSCKRKLAEDDDGDENPRKKHNSMCFSELQHDTQDNRLVHFEETEVCGEKNEVCKKVKDMSRIPQSPTVNLPNSVLDSPSTRKLQENDIENQKKQTLDWLTKIRIQKLETTPRKLKPLDHCQSPRSSQTCDLSSPVRIQSPVAGVKLISSFFRPKS